MLITRHLIHYNFVFITVFTVYNNARSDSVCDEGACHTSHAPAALKESHAICADQTVQSISNSTAATQKGRGGQEAEGGEERGARRVAERKYGK